MVTAELDTDLQSMQAARRAAKAAAEAQRQFAHASQAEVDRICAAMADAAWAESARLGDLAHTETGYGNPVHKRIKNEFASRTVWESIRDVPTVGVLHRDDTAGITEIAAPVGVIAALCPSTNPTSTAIFKVLIGVKARNAVVVAPHPSALRCTAETVRVMAAAGEAAGMPPGLISCLEPAALAGAQELIHHKDVALVLATGGPGMVKAAHGAGKPAIGVGPGNVPVYVDRSADLAKAASDIVNSKAFDGSVICATEQAVIADRPIAASLREAMEAEGAFWLDPTQAAAIAKVVFHPGGAMNPRAVGRTPQQLAEMAGIVVPATARVLMVKLDRVGREEPLSAEKLTTVLGWYEADGWRAGCDRTMELVAFGGRGHSVGIHATDQDVILQWGLEKPAFRIIVNTWTSLGAIGATTGLPPSMTLAPGGIGGSVVSDNVTVRHLLNIKRIATETRRPPSDAYSSASAVSRPVTSATNGNPDEAVVAAVLERVLAELRR